MELVEVLYDLSQLMHVLIYGDVDVAFSHDFIPLESPNISRKKVCRSRMCLAMSIRHPLAACRSIDEFDIRRRDSEVFYIQEVNDETSDREGAIVNLASYGIHPKGIRYVANFSSLMRAICQGKGMSLCGYFPKAPGHEEVRFFELTSLRESPFLTAAWRSNDLSEQLREFIDMFPDVPDEMTVFGRNK
jgi:DNA-binding transcriptional LysR family regulator